ncbi:YopX family protein [Aeribacillus composti]|uniref:YopX family protein n=1 Tax=Aeribacillus composti TaxID=1868734 RepID=UPI002E22B96D|nr:YopX family protein [Aeribacillus composti]
MEIKFRAFIKHLNCIADVLSIDFMSKEVEVYLDDRNEIRIYPFDEVEILQFTGLTDKKGREIYEGYIVKSDNGESIDKIVYKQGAFYVESLKGDLLDELLSDVETEVIGNIYEGNIYELLEGSE